MALRTPHTTSAVTARQSAELTAALARAEVPADGVGLRVGGDDIALPAPVAQAIDDLLHRFAAGDGVVVASVEKLLTTAQAAQMIGISHTYLLRLADAGTLPVQYRGTHRRFATADVIAYLDSVAGTRTTPTQPRPDARGSSEAEEDREHER